MMPNDATYVPTWLPIPRRPWRLVDVKTGSYFRTVPYGEGPSKAFKTAEDALRYARREGLTLVDLVGGSDDSS